MKLKMCPFQDQGCSWAEKLFTKINLPPLLPNGFKYQLRVEQGGSRSRKQKNSYNNFKVRAGGIWKLRFHAESASNVLHPHCDTGREESKNVTITCQFGFVFEENIGQGNHVIIDYGDAIVFAIKCFRCTRKRKADVFKFLQLQERFQNAPFSWRSNVDGRPNRRNKVAH